MTPSPPLTLFSFFCFFYVPLQLAKTLSVRPGILVQPLCCVVHTQVEEPTNNVIDDRNHYLLYVKTVLRYK